MPRLPNTLDLAGPRAATSTLAVETSLRAEVVSAWDAHGSALAGSGAAEEWLMAVVRLRASAAAADLPR